MNANAWSCMASLVLALLEISRAWCWRPAQSVSAVAAKGALRQHEHLLDVLDEDIGGDLGPVVADAAVQEAKEVIGAQRYVEEVVTGPAQNVHRRPVAFG